MTLNRLKASKSKENPSKDPLALKSLFGQLYSQLRLNKYELLRTKKHTQAFSVNFLGEGSIDVGGPYRDALSSCCSDLMSANTPLFIPSPNKRNDVGLGRDRWVITPSSSSSSHLSMYECVGVLLGIALRTSYTLNLDLPTFVWKQLLSEKPDLSDLEQIDKLFIQQINVLKALPADGFNMVEQKFTTQLSNGQEFELKKGGRDIDVTFANRDEFIALSIVARLRECESQIKAIRKGLHAIVPQHMLGLFSPFDLERMVCGDAEIDINLLKRHTNFNGIPQSSPLIKFFWAALESFNTEERQLFLRFVWGRSRLPVSENDWNQPFTINALHGGSNDTLPLSHTCFFSIDLPPYNSYDKLREKLLYAIVNCQAIDIDFTADGSSTLNAWVDTE